MPQGQILRRFITAWWRRLWKNSFLRVIPSRQLQVGDGPVGAEVGGQRRLRQDGGGQRNQGNQTYDDPQDGTFRGQQRHESEDYGNGRRDDGGNDHQAHRNSQTHTDYPYQQAGTLSLIHISEPTRRTPISY